MTEPIPLKLRWRHTWDDVEHDFSGFDRGTGKYVGRIYIWATGGLNKGQWSWFFGGSSGTAPTAREAAKAIEDLWFARER